MIQIERFGPHDYENLISWLNSEELLVQIAGRQMNYPVTDEQLDISQADPNRIAFSIIEMNEKKSIGHCELYLNGDTAKIDRVIIGDTNMKGKGLCRKLMALLLDYGFNKLNLSIIELNVFDWNLPAIRCYEGSGLKMNPDKSMQFEINGQRWTALNMEITRADYRN